ncbi:MAG: ATP-binding protein [bacterium]
MIKRDILTQLREHLLQKEITMIVGPRQAGKTTLMATLKEELDNKGEETILLNLDRDADKPYFEDQITLLNYLKLRFDNKKAYVFIDEIQRKENTGLFLKGLYDENLPYKFIVSGSGSIELKEKIHESLAGRKRIFEVNTISFKEFVNYETNYEFENKLLDFFKNDKIRPEQLLNKYLQFGGYPRVITAETLEDKTRTIQEIYTSYIEKDIRDLLNVQKSESFTNLVTILASQIGQMTVHSELSSTLNLDIETVNNYVWYLKKTFILKKTAPFFKNVRKELTKTPIYYFNDLGLRNYALNRFNSFNLMLEGGFLFQNLVALLLKQDDTLGKTKLSYWRTKGGAEMDFILTSGVDTTPIEVKFKDIKKTEISKSIKSYISEYKPKELLIVNKSFEEEMDIEGTKVKFMPYYKLVV